MVNLLIRYALSLIKYWRYGIVIAITALICFQVSAWRIDRINAAHEAEINGVIDRVQKQCETIQKKNVDISNDYQLRIKNINTRHADAIGRLLQHEANKCAGATASGFNAATPEGLSGKARIELITDLATCDKQAEQLESLQRWVRD